MVVVIEINEPAQLQMSSQRGSLTGDSFHQITVCNNRINIRLDKLIAGLVEFRGEVSGGNRHAHTLTESLPEGTGGHFDTGSQPIFRVSRCLATKLTEVLDLL